MNLFILSLGALANTVNFSLELDKANSSPSCIDEGNLKITKDGRVLLFEKHVCRQDEQNINMICYSLTRLSRTTHQSVSNDNGVKTYELNEYRMKNDRSTEYIFKDKFLFERNFLKVHEDSMEVSITRYLRPESNSTSNGRKKGSKWLRSSPEEECHYFIRSTEYRD